MFESATTGAVDDSDNGHHTSGTGQWIAETSCGCYASTAFGDVVDRSLHAAVDRLTAGLSPAALIEANMDWATHLATSPGRQIQLWEKATKKTVRFAHHSGQCALQGGSGPPCIEPLLQDKRFVGDA